MSTCPPDAPEFLDTSVLVRYLTNDPPEMAERAQRLIASRTNLCVTGTVLAETAHVLRGFYRIEREAIIDLLDALIRDDGITPMGIASEALHAGLNYCRSSGRVSVPDALIWAEARSHSGAAVYTFDQRFPGEGIRLLTPPV